VTERRRKYLLLLGPGPEARRDGLANLRRLRQNTVVEKVTNLWLERLLAMKDVRSVTRQLLRDPERGKIRWD
jgi:hypothetical protein